MDTTSFEAMPLSRCLAFEEVVSIAMPLSRCLAFEEEEGTMTEGKGNVTTSDHARLGEPGAVGGCIAEKVTYFFLSWFVGIRS